VDLRDKASLGCQASLLVLLPEESIHPICGPNLLAINQAYHWDSVLVNLCEFNTVTQAICPVSEDVDVERAVGFLCGVFLHCSYIFCGFFGQLKVKVKELLEASPSYLPGALSGFVWVSVTLKEKCYRGMRAKATMLITTTAEAAKRK